ncbi:MAG TPA: hypothetical protein VGM88_19155 [Kofleriaceae bacterium]|jgi:hypothetical protein
MKIAFLAAAALLASSAGARAEHMHDMADMTATAEPASQFSVGASLTAADFQTKAYEGDYQGITPQISWERGRFAAQAMIGVYWISENGAAYNGAGDAMLHGVATIVANESAAAGVAFGAMLPTGQEMYGLGMGHVMVMPSVWGMYGAGPLRIAASVGYTRALTTLGGIQHDHGAWPLVDPMNMQEISWSAAADVAVWRKVRVGGRVAGGDPIDLATGVTRVTAGGRASWSNRRVETAVEVQAGVMGDPFTVRGVVETALRF